MARARKTALWAAWALVLLFSIWGLNQLIQRIAEASPQIAANRVFLAALTIVIVVLSLGLAGVLIRNLVRLVMDRKRGILGSKLRTKLVFFFLGLVLLPALVLSYGAGAVIKRTVEDIYRTPLEDVTEPARQIAEDWQAWLLSRSQREAEALAAKAASGGYLEAKQGPRLEALLADRRMRDEFQVLVVTKGASAVAESVDPEVAREPTAREILELSTRIAVEAGKQGRVLTRVNELETSLFVQAAAPGPVRSGFAVSVGTVLPLRFTSRIRKLSAVEEFYREARAERREQLRLYYSLLALVGLVTVFVASWIGFYLSRRITVPIQDLAAASREISSGNLGVRVRAEAGDEVGMLVDAFNEMAAQLQESREVITRSTADLRRSNQALEERRRYIETLLANLSTAVVSLDRDGCVTTANPAARRILGIPLASGDNLRSRIQTSDLEPLGSLLDEAGARVGQTTRGDLVFSRPGDSISVSVQMSPLHGGQGEELGTLIMVEDLTDLLRAQRAAAWKEVARRIAHEIKNPLTPIQLAAQRVRKKFTQGAADLGETLIESTESIEREVGALKRLVDEFSRYARMPEVTPELVEFNKVVESALALYQGVPGVEWEVKTGGEVGAVRVDPEQMRRVLINLIDNSVAAMSGRGTIRIATSRDTGSGSLRLEVADTGPGIPLADRQRLFEPYFSTKRRGTGLGLSIVHRIVTEHRGTIHVEENQPSGARFVIEIPA